MAKKKRKKSDDEGHKPDPAMILFTALGMIMLAFFIVLNSMASIDDVKARKALDSLVGTFGVLPEGKSLAIQDLASIGMERTTDPPAYRRIKEIAKANPQEIPIVVESQDGSIRIRLQPGTLFAPGGVHISPAFFKVLDELAQVIIQYPEERVRVEGHTDAKPPGRGKPSNWYFSSARAASVLRYIEASADLPRGRIEAHGFASTQPLPGISPDDPEQRRVDIVFLPKVENIP